MLTSNLNRLFLFQIKKFEMMKSLSVKFSVFFFRSFVQSMSTCYAVQCWLFAFLAKLFCQLCSCIGNRITNDNVVAI